MKTRLRALLVSVGLWLARRGGWMPCALPHPSPELIDQARTVVRVVHARMPDAPGEIKRREALRVLLNISHSRERDLNLLIELALQ